MSNFTAADVKKLRDLTGAGMLDCKKALEEADGEFERAVEILRIKGAKDVGKRAGRTAANGLVAHSGRALLELTAETTSAPKTPTSAPLAKSPARFTGTTRPPGAEGRLAPKLPPAPPAPATSKGRPPNTGEN